MTNKFLLNLLGFNPDLTSRQSRVDSVSILSRQSVLAILMLCLTLGVGNAWGTETVVYSTGFESLSAGTDYKNTQTYSGTSDGTGTASWSVYYGTASTTNAISGDNSVQMRVYKNDANLGSITQTSDISNVDSIRFDYKVSNTNVVFKVEYSTNSGSSWSELQTGISCAATNTVYTFKSLLATRASKFRIRITITGGTHSSNTARQFTVDNFVYKTISNDCSNAIALSNGTATNGTINSISSASVATCGDAASRQVTVTITPEDCYDAPTNLTYTGSGTATKQSKNDNGDGSFSYIYQFAQNDNGSGTFGVTCTAKNPGKTVNFDAGPGVSASSSLTEKCDGSGVTLPAVTASGVCKGWTTFAGWATSAVSDSTTTSVTVYAAGSKYTPASDNMTLYAVYSKVKGGAGLTSVVGGNMSSSLPSGWSKSGAGQYSGNGVKFDDEGDWILSPDFSSQNLTKVTVKFKAGNNGSAGSVLRFEAIDKDGYEITGVDFSPTEAYDNQSTENSVVIDAGEKIYTIAVELTDRTSNVGMKYCEVFKSSSTTYYCSDPTCCTPLGSINGSFW